MVSEAGTGDDATSERGTDATELRDPAAERSSPDEDIDDGVLTDKYEGFPNADDDDRDDAIRPTPNALSSITYGQHFAGP